MCILNQSSKFNSSDIYFKKYSCKCMISKRNMDNIDSLGMYKIYDKWPEIAKEAYEIDENSIEFENIDNIIFAGMGGSGAIGDIFYSILSKTDKHVSVVKGYQIPKTVDANTLVVTTSVSGNTSETLTVLETAKKIDTNVVAFSSNGKMKEYCKLNNISHKIIPQYHSPRASFTAYLYGMLKILKPILPINETDIQESIKGLFKLRDKISSSNLCEENPSLELANWINGIPLIYYPWGLQSSAIRFKNSLQENGKTHVIAEDVVEACHNGIVSWEKKSNVKPILLQGKDDYDKTKERWKILKEYFNTNEIKYKEIYSEKGSILTKIINLIYLLDYTSIYYAINQKIDPSPIPSIDFVKKRSTLG
jgi:glucose/mannose-6-phosphate isomerase